MYVPLPIPLSLKDFYTSHLITLQVRGLEYIETQGLLSTKICHIYWYIYMYINEKTAQLTVYVTLYNTHLHNL